MKAFLTTLFLFSGTTLFAQIEFYECLSSSKKQYVTNSNLTPRHLLSGQDSVFFNWKIDTGQQIVFKYSNTYSCDPTNHDAVFTDLIWSIPMFKTSFDVEFSNIDTVSFPILYHTGCGPPCRKYYFDMVTGSGKIQGELVRNNWIIKGKIKMTLLNRSTRNLVEKEISFDDVFVLWKQEKKYKKGHKFNGF